MNISGDDYPNFEVDENDLLNFEDFCDVKYKDPCVQQLGFFKVHLGKDTQKQSSIKEFLTNFSGDVYRAVKETIIIDNPLDCGLYGHHNINVPDTFRQNFMRAATPDAFNMTKTKLNCCTECLENHGVDAFLEHFFSEITTKAISLYPKNQQRRNIRNITQQIPTWRAAYEKRQQFKKQNSIQEKSRVLELSMQAEKFNECHEGKECECDTCAYLKLEVPVHVIAPVGTLYSSGIAESYEKHVKLTTNVSMAQMCYKNMLSMLDSTFDGVSFPALYVGTSHTTFPMHVEDLSLWSFNFLFFGFPKFWIVVPPHAVGKLTDALTRCGFGGIHKTCRNLLGHKFFIPSVTWLISEEVPFNVVFQREEEGIVLLPNAAHSGGNLGHNVAEACNYGTKTWIPYGCVYPFCTCIEESVHADLAPIVAVHYKDLLKAYINNNILTAAGDDYFLKSVVLSRSTKCEDHLLSSKESRPRLKCPVCPYNWGSSIPLANVMKHLTKFHTPQLKGDFVTKFLEEKFPNSKKLKKLNENK